MLKRVQHDEEEAAHLQEPVQCHRTLLLGAVAPDADVTHLFA